MKMSEYPSLNDITNNDKFVIDTPNGTKSMEYYKLKDNLNKNLLPYEYKDPFYDRSNAAAVKNGLWRGLDLGNTITLQQKQEIQDGQFGDLYLGDYWISGGIKYRIMGFNCWLGKLGWPRNTYIDINHIIIMPDTPLTDNIPYSVESYYNTYTESCMYSDTYENRKLQAVEDAKDAIYSIFPSGKIIHGTRLLCIGVFTGDGPYYDMNPNQFEIEAPETTMIFGNWTMLNDEQNSELEASRQTNFPEQLPAFRLNPNLIYTGQPYYLADPTATGSMLVGPGHVISYGNVLSAVAGFRPVFAYAP